MLKNAKKKDEVIFLVVPLLIASLCFFVVYISSISNYYDNYETLISNSYPDYLILKENSSVFHNPSFSKTNISNKFSLEDYEYMGYLESEIKLGEFNKTSFAIIWAPNSYYMKCSNLSLDLGEIFVESYLRNEYLNNSNQIFTLFSLSNGYEINTTLVLKNYVQREEVFVNDSLMHILNIEFNPELSYIFMNDETFENLFFEQLDEVSTYDLYLFQFKRNILYSTFISKITTYLKIEENKLNSYFDYQYNKFEFSFQQKLLREKLIRFENEYKFFGYFQIPLLLLIVGLFNISLINISTKTYSSNQSNNINLYRIRGGKRSETYKLFLKNEIKIMFLAYFISLVISLIISFSVVPSFLKFSLNYLTLAGTLVLIIVACGAYQIIMLVNSLQKRETLQSKKKNNLERLLSFFKEIGILIIPSVMCVLFYIILTGTLREFEISFKIWKIVLYFILILAFSYLISKETLLKTGFLITSKITRKVKLFKYTKHLSKKLLLQKNLLSKLIVIFVLLISTSFSVLDSYNHYLSKNEQFNQISDITINYQVEACSKVDKELREYVNSSVEIIHFRFSKEIVTIEGGTITVDGYSINSTKINQLFENENFKDSYSGLESVQEVSSKLIDNRNSIIVSEGVSRKTQKGIGESLNFFIPETGKHYSGEINDYVKTTPIFSWFTKNYYSKSTGSSSVNFIILNSDFEENLLEYKNLEVISVINLKESKTKEEVINQIDKLNSQEHLGIKIIDFTKISFFDEEYQSLFIQREFLLMLIILISSTLVTFLLEYSNQLFNQQIDNFKVFFSRGISIKSGTVLALIPMFIFSNYLILLGTFFGWIFSSMIISGIQPVDYMKITFYIIPSTILSLSCLLLSILLIALLVGLLNYKLLKKQIPAISYSENYTDLVEGV
ncbi:MAG: hypothetical protein ACTSVO_10685 [Candidatus Heimdallarchaeaceae archaeon]